MKIKKAFSLANEYYSKGDLRQAASIYNKILKSFPDNVDALHFMGIIYYQLGDHDSAIKYIERELHLNPLSAEAYNNLGLVMRGKGNLNDAISLFKKAIELKPYFANAYYNLGLTYQDMKEYDKAIYNYERAIKIEPNFVEAYNNLGIVLRKVFRLDESVACFKKALQINPNLANTYNNLGLSYQDKEQYDEALKCYQKALQLNPNLADAYNNIGNVLRTKEEFEDSLKYYEKALSLNPNLPESYIGIGCYYQQKEDMDKAMIYYKKALSIDGDSKDAYFSMGAIYSEKGMNDESIDCYRKAISINPNFVYPHYNISFCLLLKGNFEEGWAEYEWRWKTKEFEALRRDFGKPRWYGEEIRGKRIFLTCEQGLGDAIQFVRYAKRVKDLGAEVILEVPKVLHRLFMYVEGIDSLVIVGSELPNFDVYCPLLSLPYVFKTNLETIPNEVPYIKVNSETIEMWGEKIEKGKDRLNVGIAWTGNPKHKRDKYRSIRLEKFAIFNELKGVRYYSLQVGVGSEQLKEVGSKFEIVDLTGEIKDFFDTAGLIMNLDLVITVDTSVAHLAGALGKQVWVFIPFVPDWRWMLNREDSPWYPTMRLFRQNERNDWDSVIKRVYEELGKLVNK